MTQDVVIIHPAMTATGHWIDDFVDPGAPFTFRKIGAPRRVGSWHNRGQRTPLSDWFSHLRHSFAAMTSGAEIVVANFPQLTLTACLWKFLLFRKTRIVGWSFNLGLGRHSRMARFAGWVLRRASLLIVHSRAEVEVYSQVFDLPKGNFRFVPLQRGKIEFGDAPVKKPDGRYIIAMGSAARDYRTMFEAVKDIDAAVLVIAKDDAVTGLDVPANVELRSGLSMQACWELAAGSDLMVVPIAETGSAAGQVTFLIAMQLGIPLIATRCPGTEDYLRDGVDALLVEPEDVDGMREAIDKVHEQSEVAEMLSSNAKSRWSDAYSDEAAAENLASVLRSVSPENAR